MPEVLGDAAILEPVSSAERFATGIRRVLTDNELHRDLRARGIQRAQSFRYETSVKQLLEIFEEASGPISAKLGQQDAVAGLDSVRRY
jgi:glycosyltransferase involved in cell wall biosynthesis